MSKPRVASTVTGSRRAQRFVMTLPIQYRPITDPTWSEGQIENISHTGVLWRGEKMVSVATPIQMRFELPAEFGGEPGALVICQGKVVRTYAPPSPDAPQRLAADILDYHFVRGGV